MLHYAIASSMTFLTSLRMSEKKQEILRVILKGLVLVITEKTVRSLPPAVGIKNFSDRSTA
ncbi:hypothetical protein [Nostoc sp.]|uniref:hypothetical protein n=1 Tax=Nostoc sp. TaxID=1180 RepID=UPI002FF800DA